MEQVLTKEEAYSIHRLLSLVISIFSSIKLDYWANGGTLLGAVRCGGMILHDDDMDLAINLKDRDILLSDDFQKRLGWLRLKLVSPSKLYYKIKWVEDPTDMFIDICLIDEDGLDLRKDKKKRKYNEGEIYPLRSIQFSTISELLRIPNKSEEYLDRIFPNWKTTAHIYNHSDKKKHKYSIPLTDDINIPVKYYFR